MSKPRRGPSLTTKLAAALLTMRVMNDEGVLEPIIPHEHAKLMTADQVAIAWAGTHGAVPMIGPRSLAQLTSNLGALALGLSAEQLGRLDTVSGVGPSAPARKLVPWASDERVRRAVA